MAHLDEQPAKPQKSVAFSENGEVSGTKDMPGEANEVHDTQATGDRDIQEVTELFKNLKKKKPKAQSDSPADNGAGLPTTKKKKKAVRIEAMQEFEAKLADIEVDKSAVEEDVREKETSASSTSPHNIEESATLWGHDSTTPLPYTSLLGRFFDLIESQHPEILASGSKSFKVPPPQCLREGNKKTILANLPEICQRLHRSEEHVIQFLFAELGTSGSVDGSKRLVIKGRFQQKQIENILRRYVMEYVTCKTCRTGNTTLSRGENRLYFMECNVCGSRRSVSAIKIGFAAQIGKRKRMRG